MSDHSMRTTGIIEPFRMFGSSKTKLVSPLCIYREEGDQQN